MQTFPAGAMKSQPSDFERWTAAFTFAGTAQREPWARAWVRTLPGGFFPPLIEIPPIGLPRWALIATVSVTFGAPQFLASSRPAALSLTLTSTTPPLPTR